MGKNYLFPSLFLFFISIYTLNASPGKNKFKSKNFYQEIPYKLVHDKMVIPVNIEGETYQFLFDTGGLLGISEEIYARIPKKKKRKGKFSGINNIKTKIQTVKLPIIKIGDLAFENFTAFSSDFFTTYPASCIQIDGMIGRDFFKQMLVHIDCEQKLLVLTDQAEKLNLEEANACPLNLNASRSTSIEVKTNTGSIKNVEIDTGSGDIFSIKKADFEKLVANNIIQEENVFLLEGAFSLGISLQIPEPAIYHRIYFPELNIAGAQLRNIISQESKNSRPRIGTGLLAFGSMTLDYRNKKFYFHPKAPIQEGSYPSDFGFKFMKDEEGFFVTGLYKESPAEKAGIKLSQKIVSIEGIVLSNTPEEQLCEYWRRGYPWKDQDQIKVTVLEEDNREKTLIIPKVWLIKNEYSVKPPSVGEE